MSVNYSVLIEIFRVVSVIHKRTTVSAVISVEILFKIIRIVGRLNNLNVYTRVRNAYPAYQFLIKRIEVSIFCHHTVGSFNIGVLRPEFLPKLCLFFLICGIYYLVCKTRLLFFGFISLNINNAECHSTAYKHQNREICNRLSDNFGFFILLVRKNLSEKVLEHFVEGLYPLFTLSRLNLFKTFQLALFFFASVTLKGVSDIDKVLLSAVFYTPCGLFVKGLRIFDILCYFGVNIIGNLGCGKLVFGLSLFFGGIQLFVLVKLVFFHQYSTPSGNHLSAKAYGFGSPCVSYQICG